jgi:hypothetical protein
MPVIAMSYIKHAKQLFDVENVVLKYFQSFLIKNDQGIENCFEFLEMVGTKTLLGRVITRRLSLFSYLECFLCF